MRRRREVVHFLRNQKALCGHGGRGGPEPRQGTTDVEQVTCVACRKLTKTLKA